jgi:hypothetical protein
METGLNFLSLKRRSVIFEKLCRSGEFCVLCRVGTPQTLFAPHAAWDTA